MKINYKTKAADQRLLFYNVLLLMTLTWSVIAITWPLAWVTRTVIAISWLRPLTWITRAVIAMPRLWPWKWFWARFWSWCRPSVLSIMAVSNNSLAPASFVSSILAAINIITQIRSWLIYNYFVTIIQIKASVT